MIFDRLIAKSQDFHLNKWKWLNIMSSVNIMGEMPEIKIDFVPGKAQLSIFLCDTTVEQILKWSNEKLVRVVSVAELKAGCKQLVGLADAAFGVPASERIGYMAAIKDVLELVRGGREDSK